VLDLEPDELDVAKAIQSIRHGYMYKRAQLTKALGRIPTSKEMLSVARADITIIANLHKLLESHGIKVSSSHTVIPVSLLVQIFLTKVLQGGILSSSTEENIHDQPE
jgi:hypothetical protein